MSNTNNLGAMIEPMEMLTQNSQDKTPAPAGVYVGSVGGNFFNSRQTFMPAHASEESF
jgi:hypothetical protein